MDTVLLLGEAGPGGTYVLRLAVAQPLAISFGRFAGGELIPIPAGAILYTGSALGQAGGAALARRLLRHATRSGAQPPHPIRTDIERAFAAAGAAEVALRPPRQKRLHWHVDYLLDQPQVSLTHIIALRSQQRLEAAVSQLLQADPLTGVLRPGLGASDLPGHTNLLLATADVAWWANLAHRLAGLLPPNSFA